MVKCGGFQKNRYLFYIHLPSSHDDVNARSYRQLNLGPFSADPSCKLDVFGHDSNTLCVNGT